MKTQIRVICILTTALSLATPVAAQDFPSRQITFVVMQSPGTPPDILSRLLATPLSRSLAQPVIVENRTGAGGILGLEFVAKNAPADGHTAAVVSMPLVATLPATTKDLRFDPVKDLTPVMSFAEGRFMVVSPAQAPWKTATDMLAYVKANPAKVNYANTSQIGRLLIEALLGESSGKATAVPYNNVTLAFQGLTSGDVHMAITSEGQAVGFGEKARVIAQTGEQRSRKFPEVPTYKELGHPYVQGNTYSVNVRAGTPKAIVDRLYAEISRVLEQPGVRGQIEKLGVEIKVDAPNVAEKRMLEQSQFLTGIAKRIGLSPQ